MTIPYKQKRCKCPRCTNDGYIRTDRDSHKLEFECFVCSFRCRARDIKKYADHFARIDKGYEE